MERHDESAAAGDVGKRPAGPSQPDDGFAEGIDQKPDGPEEQLTPNFARGIGQERDEGDMAEGRFSRGIEEPGTEEESDEGRFSEGIEQLPHEDR
jgi:hypothetical protein